jgi:hypothetical protein
MTANTGAVISRRGLIAGGLAGAGAAALAGCGPDPPDGVLATDVLAVRVRQVPVDDPASELWDRAPEKVVELDGQIIALPNRPKPAVPSIRVKILYDAMTIGFRIEWDDAESDDLTVEVDRFRDACAVLLAPGAGDAALRFMGSQQQPATLLHWKADWQRDVDQGVQGEAEVYPNRSIDTYPPLTGTKPGDVTAVDYQKAGATEWLPGLHVGNPLSAATRAVSIEKLVAHGFGTAATAELQDCRGRGTRTDQGWQVVIAKPMASSQEGEVALSVGGTATCAFAIWSGSESDAGSKKSPSVNVYRLVLEP